VTLVDQILDVHGGVDRWYAMNEIQARLKFGGLAFDMRLNRKGLRERSVYVQIDKPRVIFDDYPKPGKRGVFTADEVRVESNSGKILTYRKAPRSAFTSFRRRLWWDDLDLLYFAGYACWNYFTAPFLFSYDGVKVTEIESARYQDKEYRRVKVDFPSELPTHNPEQVFWYDPELKLRRHDYIPEVFAHWAWAAHICEDHKKFDGFLFPMRRYVIPRSA